ncbi:MAG: flagellar biosynthesis protein FlhF [Lachnospiraceae bacterium]|nr:flagellar biosynthesis protein FlhF [Lachnospiraceae bacterium]
MVIKKYQAKTEEEAVEAAKKELGDDITVIHSRNVKPKGFFAFLKKMQVEITVAKEEEMDRPQNTAKETLAQVNRLREKAEKENTEAPLPERSENNTEPKVDAAVEAKLENIQNLLEQKLSRHSEEEKEKKTAKAAADTQDDDKRRELMEFRRLLYNTLVENEVSERVANELVDDIEQNCPDDMQMEHVLSHIYQKIILKFGRPGLISPGEKGPKVVFFIGPTGVGKTTTLAKIASKMRLAQNKRVVLFTTDTYRISATDQLKTYAGILGTPFHIIYTPEELEETYAKYRDADYILIDTAGHSHNNVEQKKDMSEFISVLDGKAECEYYLVVSATTKYKDLLAIADAYKELADYRLIFTKLDETEECGNLLNLKLHTGASLSYVTNGQNVPDDIEEFNPQAMARGLLTDPSSQE